MESIQTAHRREAALWHNRSYLLLWGEQIISSIGTLGQRMVDTSWLY
jgi:hypothetical protein